ncbi:MAG TPA: ferrous iron transporter B, partial [Halieaceae bacterium]|nr:ferrous iron transporter B [Halieaceae bacterium]
MTRVLLIGSPNSGKSLLFNRLTGLSQKVANFPGITVDVATGKLQGMDDVDLVDFPGTYSLKAISAEEKVAVAQFEKALEDTEVEHVLCLIDATRLEKSLFFTLQVIRECEQHGKAVTVLANMIDVLEANNLSIDLAALETAIHTRVIPISARSGKGLADIAEQIRAARPAGAQAQRPHLTDTPDELLRGTAHQLAQRLGPRGDVLVRTQNRLDAFFLHSFTGGFAFFGIMYLLFQSIFTWSTPAMDAIESSLAWMADGIVPLIGNSILQDFTADAL